MPRTAKRSVKYENVELIPENSIYKLDAAGRIIIPSHMRNKFDIDLGDFFEYFTTYIDGKWFLCACKVEDEHLPEDKQEEKKRDKARIAERERRIKEEVEKLEKAKNESGAKV